MSTRPREYYNRRKTAPDEETVTIVDFKPDKPEPETMELRTGLSARDSCGDGTNEFRHIEPLVTFKVFPVRYYIDTNTMPTSLHKALERSFNTYNEEAGYKFFERTTNQTLAKVKVNIGPIDVPGGTIARAQWSYKSSTKEITNATITFDSNEAWSDLVNESCGRTGAMFDLPNVATHEIGHICGLSHAPTDKLQTMYASTSPGVTLCRTLGNGDRQGFRLAYKITDNPIPPPPDPVPPTPTNQAPIAKNITIKTKYKHFLISLQGSDPDNNLPLIYRPGQPENGTIVPYNKIEYKTDMIEGTDSFTYTVTDSKGQESAPAKVTLHILKD